MFSFCFDCNLNSSWWANPLQSHMLFYLDTLNAMVCSTFSMRKRF